MMKFNNSNSLSVSYTSSEDDIFSQNNNENKNENKIDCIPVYQPKCFITNPKETIPKKYNYNNYYNNNNSFSIKEFKNLGLGQYCYGLNNYIIAERIGNDYNYKFKSIGTVCMVWDSNNNKKNTPMFSFKNNGSFIRYEKNVKGKSIIIYRPNINKKSNNNNVIKHNYTSFINKSNEILIKYKDVTQIRHKMEQYMGGNISVVKGSNNVKLFSHFFKPYLYQYVNNKKEFITIWQNCIE